MKPLNKYKKQDDATKSPQVKDTKKSQRTQRQMSETRIKAQIVGEGRIGGYLILWGTPRTRDLHGEYFTPQTELGLDWYAQRPVLYQHGLDGQLKAAVIGQIDLLRTDETGVWAEAQLDLRQRY